MTPGYLAYPNWLAPALSPGLPLRWYGILLAGAVLVCWFLFRSHTTACSLLPPTREGRDLQARFFTYVLLGALLGSRLVYLLTQDGWQSYLGRPWRIVWPFEDGTYTGVEGFNEFGAIVGASAGVILFSAVARQEMVRWADALALTGPLFTLFARLGNFANREFLGRVTTLRWGVVFPNAERYSVAEQRISAVLTETGVPVAPGQLLVNLPRHPVQLYEALVAGVLLWAIGWFLIRTRPLFRGATTGLILTGHGVVSFVLGYYREADDLFRWAGLPGDPRFVDTLLMVTPHQVAAGATALVGVAICIAARIAHSPEPTVATYEEAQTE